MNILSSVSKNMRSYFLSKIQSHLLIHTLMRGFNSGVCAHDSVWDGAVLILHSLPCLHPPIKFD